MFMYIFCHPQIINLEKSLEEMLTRVDEFVGMLDMVSDTCPNKICMLGAVFYTVLY